MVPQEPWHPNETGPPDSIEIARKILGTKRKPDCKMISPYDLNFVICPFRRIKVRFTSNVNKEQVCHKNRCKADEYITGDGWLK